LFQSFGLLQYRSFGYGHSFGVLSHYYGREAGLELREDIETVIEVEIGSKIMIFKQVCFQPGMVVSMEPMITIPEGQPGAGGYRYASLIYCTRRVILLHFREHDIIVVNQDGSCENITKFPFGPEHNVV